LIYTSFPTLFPATLDENAHCVIAITVPAEYIAPYLKEKKNEINKIF
jgi:hypothetical protein